MAKICPVCSEEVGFWRIDMGGGVLIHSGCESKYLADTKKFGRQIDEELEARLDHLHKVQVVKLTTAFTFNNHEIEDEVGIVTAECVFGMNIFRDFFAGMTDFFGGRSEASQKILRDARNSCLNELKLEAYELGADGVIGIDLDYSEISGKGKGMLFLVASGTAVTFKKGDAKDG